MTDKESKKKLFTPTNDVKDYLEFMDEQGSNLCTFRWDDQTTIFISRDLSTAANIHEFIQEYIIPYLKVGKKNL